jgi:hypothetical protein
VPASQVRAQIKPLKEMVEKSLSKALGKEFAGQCTVSLQGSMRHHTFTSTADLDFLVDNKVGRRAAPCAVCAARLVPPPASCHTAACKRFMAQG